MIDPALLFDPRAARRPPYRHLLREYWSLISHDRAAPAPGDFPDGGGRPVMVVPGFLTGDSFSRRLRQFLQACGFHAVGWGLGLNWGPTPRKLAGFEAAVAALHGSAGRVSLVGISLGGLFARNLAHERPELLRHVVTIASPFRLPTASTLELAVRACAWSYSPDVRLDRLRAPLPVPSTMIFTCDDGFVDCDSCWAEEPGGTVVALSGPHITLARTPAAMATVARRLAEA